MRIAYILTSLGIGGAERQTIALAEGMAARGHVVTLVVMLYGGGEEWPTRLPVMRLNMGRTLPALLRGAGFAARFLQAFASDIIHSHTYPANIFTRWLRLRGVSARVVQTVHNVYEGGLHRMLLYRLSAPLADQMTAVSEAAATRYVRLGAVKAASMRVLSNGVNGTEFESSSKRRREMRRALGLRAEFVWVAVGRLAEAKDYPNLLAAFSQVVSTEPAARLLIAGEGDPSEYGEAALQSGVTWLGLRRDVVGLMDAADAFVLASAWEGLPLVVAEAMAMERVVVATDVGGVREVVGDCGLLVPAQNPNSLAEAMLTVMQLSEFARVAKGHEARRRILEQFSIDAKIDEFERLYEEVIKRG